MISAVASAGRMATAAASGSVSGRSKSVSGGGTGCVAAAVRVTAGTSSLATTVPRTTPSTAAGTLSSSFSRHSCSAAERWLTPSAASSAFSARRCRTFAAIDTQNPVIASSAAATASASSACCGVADSGSPVSSAVAAAEPVTALPGGSAPDKPGGIWWSAVVSHHSVTLSGGAPWLTTRCWTAGKSTMSAPVLAVTVGKLFTTATIDSATCTPLSVASTTDPVPTLFESANALVAIAGIGARVPPEGAFRLT